MTLLEPQVDALQEQLAQECSVGIDIAGARIWNKNEHSGLILKKESFCELGGPETDSAFVALYGNGQARDCVRLVGDSLASMRGKAVPFALCAVLYGKNLTAEVFYQFLLRAQRLADHPGRMVKIDKSRIWMRIGENAADRALEDTAATLIARIHEAFADVEAVHLTFVVNRPDLVSRLSEAAREHQTILRELKTGVWRDRGFDYKSCQLSGHCGACADKKTCASVRKMEARVKMLRRNNKECTCEN